MKIRASDNDVRKNKRIRSLPNSIETTDGDVREVWSMTLRLCYDLSIITLSRCQYQKLIIKLTIIEL